MTCWRKNISARPASPPSFSRSSKPTCRTGCGARLRTRPRSPPCPPPSATGRSAAPNRSSIVSPAPGPIGAGKAATSTRKKTPAPNSPQWFNTGLHWAYGIDGPAQGHHYVDFRTGELTVSASAYEHPQPHACFIQSVNDDLVNEGGIMDLWVREARLFKYGSGTGSNFSKLRGDGEKLSG